MSSNRSLGQKIIEQQRREKVRHALTDNDIAFLDGLLDAHDDLPDGAWQCACEDSIRECPRFKGLDPYTVWLAWCEANRA